MKVYKQPSKTKQESKMTSRSRLINLVRGWKVTTRPCQNLIFLLEHPKIDMFLLQNPGNKYIEIYFNVFETLRVIESLPVHSIHKTLSKYY